MFFVDGPGGSGKTFLYNTILAYYRSQKKFAIAVASSGLQPTLNFEFQLLFHKTLFAR